MSELNSKPKDAKEEKSVVDSLIGRMRLQPLYLVLVALHLTAVKPEAALLSLFPCLPLLPPISKLSISPTSLVPMDAKALYRTTRSETALLKPDPGLRLASSVLRLLMSMMTELHTRYKAAKAEKVAKNCPSMLMTLPLTDPGVLHLIVRSKTALLSPIHDRLLRSPVPRLQPNPTTHLSTSHKAAKVRRREISNAKQRKKSSSFPIPKNISRSTHAYLILTIRFGPILPVFPVLPAVSNQSLVPPVRVPAKPR